MVQATQLGVVLTPPYFRIIRKFADKGECQSTSGLSVGNKITSRMFGTS
ncbi:MAG: hypothetical protein ACI867_001683, partial [Glaciecola sp.]